MDLLRRHVVASRYAGGAWNDGASWKTQSLAATNAVTPAEPGELLAVGNGGAIARWTGSAWTVEASGTTTDLYAVWYGAGTALAVGSGGTILERRGGTWHGVPSGSTATLRSIAGSVDSSIIIAVGSGGTILRSTATAR